MSGGAFNYLFMKEFGDMMYNPSFFDEMLETLREKGFNDVADEIEDIKNKFCVLEEEIDKFRDVFHAVEWNVSGDYGVERVEEAVRKLRDE